MGNIYMSVCLFASFFLAVLIVLLISEELALLSFDGMDYSKSEKNLNKLLIRFKIDRSYSVSVKITNSLVTY